MRNDPGIKKMIEEMASNQGIITPKDLLALAIPNTSRYSLPKLKVGRSKSKKVGVSSGDVRKHRTLRTKSKAASRRRNKKRDKRAAK